MTVQIGKRDFSLRKLEGSTNPEWVQANQSISLLSGQLLWLSSLAMFLGSPSGQTFLAIRVGHTCLGARLGRISRGTRGCPHRWGLSLHFKASGPLPPRQILLANARSQTLQVNPTGQILLAIEPSLPSQNLRAKPSRLIPLGQSSKSSHTRQTIWPNLSKSTPRSQPFRVQTCWAILHVKSPHHPSESNHVKSSWPKPILQVNPPSQAIWANLPGKPLLAIFFGISTPGQFLDGQISLANPSRSIPRGETLLANHPGHV